MAAAVGFSGVLIVLAPHLLRPGNIDMEISSLAHGAYNLGFLAVSRAENSARFLQWWAERLFLYCYDDKSRGIFTDQKWIDLVPSFFDCHILKHHGYDFATWSLLGSELVETQAGYAANGDPLPNVVPAGPDNPLGPFKFTLGTPGYLIHGSNKKFGIGMRTSHGCFRMFNNNVLELSKMVPVGTPVRIINEPYKFGISGGKVYLEAHTPLDDQGNPSVVDKHTAVINTLLKREDLANNLRMNWDMVRDVVAAEDGMPVEIAVPVQNQGNAPMVTSIPPELQ